MQTMVWLPLAILVYVLVAPDVATSAATPKNSAVPKAKHPGTKASCPKPCYVVKDYWPFSECKAECDPQICNRGWGAWQSEEVCCSPAVAFPGGCHKRPEECWVAESTALRTCIRDDRKCLQGAGVWPSQAACCAANAAFTEGCNTNVQTSTKPCYVVDTYFPARLCRSSNTLCTAASGAGFWETQEACCGPQGAFGTQGCSVAAPTTPCFVIDSYWPERRCRRDNDVAVCNRGWGTYTSAEICCTPNVAFPQGCSSTGQGSGVIKAVGP